MRRVAAFLFACLISFALVTEVCSTTAFAEQAQKEVAGKIYDLGEDDKYELSKAQEVEGAATRFYVKGDISSAPENNGFVSFAVNSGNMAIMIDDQFGMDLYEQEDSHNWHIISDKAKVVDGISLSESIGSGAIIIQTSRDGITWITTDTETDIYNKWDSINNRSVNGESMQAFYKTTNVQQTNGCYYRIIVAYKLKREVDPTKVLFVPVKNTEVKQRVEVYQFYLYDPSVNREETLNTNNAYEFSDVQRVESQVGFDNPARIKAGDPHNNWRIGRFYVSGCTAKSMDGDVPVFLKVPGDRAALWFVLEQELDKCNGDIGKKVDYISSGSDTYFDTPLIANFGRGALIIRRTDKQNHSERYIYTNYLEASATVGANTRVDLFEEGDYEVALDYQLHFDKPFVFGTTTTKTLTYRVFFKFKVRNGDISAFIRDVDTNKFITNANVAPHGFYIDVANSQYLTMTIKREVLSDSLDGLVEDTKLSEVAKEGRHYTDEGIYTVTIKNLATGDSVTKRVYVGDQDILLVHMKTGMTISEINERLAGGAHIEDGQLIDPVPGENEPPVEEVSEPIEEAPVPEITENVEEQPTEATPSDDPAEAQQEEAVLETSTKQGDQNVSKPSIIVVGSVAAVLLVSVITILSRKTKKKYASAKED